jgi:LuxR family quorum-sensing transcriptional regulator LasR
MQSLWPSDEMQLMRSLSDVQAVRTYIASWCDRLRFQGYFYMMLLPIGDGRVARQIIADDVGVVLDYPEDAHNSAPGSFAHHLVNEGTSPFVWYPGRCVFPTAWQDTAALFRMQLGVLFNTYGPKGEASVLGFAANTPYPEVQRAISIAMPHGQLLAACLQDTVHKVISTGLFPASSPLTPREMECLRWVAAGKTSWEISRILKVTEHTVVHHVRTFTRKLGVHSRHQAVLRAAALGLVKL